MMQWSQYRESHKPLNSDKFCSVTESEMKNIKSIAQNAENLKKENKANDVVKEEIKKTLSSVEVLKKKGTIEREREMDKKCTVSKCLNVLLRIKVKPLKLSMLGGIQKPTNNTEFIAQLKKKTICTVFKQPDHWWRDRH